MPECGRCVARRQFVVRTVAAMGGMWLIGGTPAMARGARGPGRDEVRYPVPAADGITIDRDNEVILARKGALVAAFALSCPHQRTMLKWNEADQRFQCPKHKSRYQPTGEFISGRATRNMDRYAVRREGAAVVVLLDRIIESDKDPAGWAAAAIPV